ncbi:hypothetical protein [Haloferula helveola]
MRTGLLAIVTTLLLVGCDREPEEREADGSGNAPPPHEGRPVSADADGGEAVTDASPKIRVRPPADAKPRSGKPVEGSPGFVHSPYTGEAVDIRGVLPGTDILDPTTPDRRLIRIAEGEQVVARPAPGKPGFVFSPYGNRLVDVRGIPAGTLVADPEYPTSEKKYFRVPTPWMSEEEITIEPGSPGIDM